MSDVDVLKALGLEDARTGSRAVGHCGPDVGDWEDYAEVPMDRLWALVRLVAALQNLVQWYARRKADSTEFLPEAEQPGEIREAMASLRAARPNLEPMSDADVDADVDLLLRSWEAGKRRGEALSAVAGATEKGSSGMVFDISNGHERRES